MTTWETGQIPFATRVPDAGVSLRNRLDSEALKQVDSLILTANNSRSLRQEGGRRQRKGIAALFCGVQGAGKTTAAQVVAAETGRDLYALDLAQVVSRYIGETEKNLDRVFAAAEAASAVLLFDEGDALFGKRSGVRDGSDRYANLEINLLLQRLEAFEGVAILTCSAREDLDEVFVRWCDFVITFRAVTGKAKGERFRCPQCGFRVFNRRVRTCEKCRAALPAEFAYTQADLDRLERQHRENLQSLERSASSSAGSWTVDLGGDFSVNVDWGGDGGGDGGGD